MKSKHQITYISDSSKKSKFRLKKEPSYNLKKIERNEMTIDEVKEKLKILEGIKKSLVYNFMEISSLKRYISYLEAELRQLDISVVTPSCYKSVLVYETIQTLSILVNKKFELEELGFQYQKSDLFNIKK